MKGVAVNDRTGESKVLVRSGNSRLRTGTESELSSKDSFPAVSVIKKLFLPEETLTVISALGMLNKKKEIFKYLQCSESAEISI